MEDNVKPAEMEIVETPRKKRKSLMQRYRESTYEEIFNKVFVPILCEFCATLLHTFYGSMIAPPTSPIVHASINRTILPGENAADYVVSALMPALQAGFAVWMIIVVFIRITIIQFNPVMSFSFMIVGILSPYLFIPYVIAQLFGSATGAWIAQSIKGDEPGPFRIAPGLDVGAVVGAEVMSTGVMVFFGLAMTFDRKYDQATGPMAIGFTIFQGILAGRWVGSSCFNPSRAFGPSLVIGDWKHHWVWWVGPGAGSLIFTIVYMLFFAPEGKAWGVRIPKMFMKDKRRGRGEKVTVAKNNHINHSP